MKKRIECTVTGRVQLVMYRDFVKRAARSWGLVGIVENCNNATVRVVAEGEEDMLQALITHLHKGSLLSRVDNVDVVWKESTGEFSNFVILY